MHWSEGMYLGEGYYMLVTTLSTVGYGDLEPVSNFGRGYISVVMLFTFVYLLPSQTRQMIEILSTMSPYLRDVYVPIDEEWHIVVVGNINSRALMQFLHEFFHPDHANVNGCVRFIRRIEDVSWRM